MSRITLTKTRLVAGVWEGEMTYEGEAGWQPALRVTHLDRALDGVSVEELDAARWLVRVPVPAEAISDGVQTFVISDSASGEMLNRFALVAGDPLAHDLRAEVDLLRAELDMLKRAFRRHCVETAE